MGKNVVIFSDGTGQAGGFTFDEKRSNIYKLYRATRCGPDSSIDPREQVAFYDAGLGSQPNGGFLPVRLMRWVHNIVAQATGFGITRNIIDCYAALIRLWEPGDRIFVFGFSRGAYTARCLAGVIAKCGIPRHPAKRPDLPLELDEGSTRKLAAHAVKHVYQFTYPRKLQDATPRQVLLLRVRDELAKRFREDHGSANPDHPVKLVAPADVATTDAGRDPGWANAYPHFIGVFDTVAALGNIYTFILFAGASLLFFATVGMSGWVLTHFDDTPLIGWLLAYVGFRNVFWFMVAAAALTAAGVYVFTHFKWAYEFFAEDRKASLRTIHFNAPWMKFYDYDLNPNVGYARHAISIDENRASFQRVAWYSAKTTAKDAYKIQWFEQVWFAGNHSDIGGGYPEDESRLSDIALDWMAKWATVVPDGLTCDERVLERWPYPEGTQHDEVRNGFGAITKLLPFVTWSERKRSLPGPDAVVHRSVYRRFDLPAVQVYDVRKPYRPDTLAKHKDFAAYYAPGSPLPAKSHENGTDMAEAPPAITPTLPSVQTS